MGDIVKNHLKPLSLKEIVQPKQIAGIEICMDAKYRHRPQNYIKSSQQHKD